RRLQIEQPYIFNRAGGSITISKAPDAHFETLLDNKVSRGAAVFNADVTVNVLNAYTGQMLNSSKGTTVFNGSFTIGQGKLNVKGGTYEFNGDLNLNGVLRIDAATSVMIGGTGTTAIAAEYMLTSGAGTLYLNRPGAYTLVNPFAGYLRDENCKIVFGTDHAIADGTDVSLFRTGSNSALVSGGDYIQKFGTLSVASARGGMIDMQHTAALWTFEDCSGVQWFGDLIITNVNNAATGIRFEGIADSQIAQIILDGTRLSASNVTRSNGYVYITSAIPSAEPQPEGQALRLPSVFSDHMVLQQQQSVPVWGTAQPGASITVQFDGQQKTTTADRSGKWQVALDPMPASFEPRRMQVSAVSQSKTENCTLNDVLVGEVWLCSGQSNMEWKMECRTMYDWAEAAIAAADHPNMRLFFTPVRYTAEPRETTESHWMVCTPATVRLFSAVAYHFGHKLQEDLKVPVGLIQSALGATMIEPWTPAEGFAGIEWLAAVYANAQNIKTVSPITRNTPSALFNGMINPHVPFSIRGVIWYQGEANYKDGTLYIDKTRALLNGWRGRWGTDFPYYFVQIAPFKYPNADATVLPQFWEAQSAIVTNISGTGMVVASDTATLDNIHPPHKEEVGARLALLAEAGTYGMDVVSTGPVFQTLEKSGNTLTVVFDSAEGLTTRDGNAPDWFEVAGADGVFKTASAQISGHSVFVQSGEVTDPVAVRFAWNQLAKPNLMNGAGLTASAFRAKL
ncbi:MAG: sialate O-acetylesterase, partial [Kiritimatiellales bacterium]